MATDLSFVPECYVDTNLVLTLLQVANFPLKGVNHKKGCNEVMRTLADAKFRDRFAVGIIDDDKRHPIHYAEYREVASSSYLRLMRHVSQCHYLIVISPAMDGFILSCANAVGVDVKEYGFSSDINEFKKQCKKVSAQDDPNFRKLFKKIAHSPEFVRLGKILSYLKCNRHDAIDTDLISLF